jgi:hypothetical protein
MAQMSPPKVSLTITAFRPSVSTKSVVGVSPTSAGWM